MTGNDLATALRRTKGKVSVGMLTPNDVAWIYAEKADLMEWAKRQGETETGMKLATEASGEGLYLEQDHTL